MSALVSTSSQNRGIGTRMPEVFRESPGIRAESKAEMSPPEDRIVAHVAKAPDSIEVLLANWETSRFNEPETDWGPPVGNEAW